MTHIHIVTFRGTLPIDTWNRLLKFLYDNNIPYKTIGKISKTRDDAGLLKYFDSVIFWYKKYIPYISNMPRISVDELVEKINAEVYDMDLNYEG